MLRVMTDEEAREANRELTARNARRDKCRQHHFGQVPYTPVGTIDCTHCGEQFTMDEARCFAMGFKSAMAITEIIWPALVD